MGYYTHFSLEMQENPYTIDLFRPSYNDLAKFMAMRDDNEFPLGTANWELILKGHYDSIKWYEHDRDMKAMSRKWAHIPFVLCGQGEDPHDTWAKYYLGGKSYKVKMPKWSPPPFDFTRVGLRSKMIENPSPVVPPVKSYGKSVKAVARGTLGSEYDPWGVGHLRHTGEPPSG